MLSFIVLSLASTAHQARAQGYSQDAFLEARKQQLAARNKGSSNVGFAQMSTDFLTALQLLGIRPGMTLDEAKAAAEKWGAYVKGAGPTNLQLAQQYLTRDAADASGGGIYFQFSTAATPDYRGAGALFIPGRERTSMPGVVGFKVYPLDPFGDILDPNKLIVYFVGTSLQGGSDGQISAADFVKRGAPLIGGTLIPRTSRVQNPALCEFADKYAERVLGYSQAVDLAPSNKPGAWPKCGDTTVVQFFKDPNGLIRGYNVNRFDLKLALKAYETFRQYGSEYRAAIYQARGQSNP
jgi:hypothetical protein